MPRTKINKLSDEDVFELDKKPTTQKDDKLIVLGQSVLQLSKLLLVKLVYFLEKHLIEGSFKILYLGKLYIK